MMVNSKCKDLTYQASETSLERIEGSIPIGNEERSSGECESVRS